MAQVTQEEVNVLVARVKAFDGKNDVELAGQDQKLIGKLKACLSNADQALEALKNANSKAEILVLLLMEHMLPEPAKPAAEPEVLPPA